jgi:drug/metabolite transporter (DMT)-like permease
MTGRLVVLPSRNAIFSRSIGYGAAWGAAMGAIVLLLPAAFVPEYIFGLLIFAPIAAAAGAIFGIACGLIAGVGLITLRRHLVPSRGMLRLVAGSGAGLVPASCMAALMTGSGRLWQPALAALTIITAVLAAALGPYAFFGRPPRRRQRAGSPHPATDRHESVG